MFAPCKYNIMMSLCPAVDDWQPTSHDLVTSLDVCQSLVIYKSWHHNKVVRHQEALLNRQSFEILPAWWTNQLTSLIGSFYSGSASNLWQFNFRRQEWTYTRYTQDTSCQCLMLDGHTVCLLYNSLTIYMYHEYYNRLLLSIIRRGQSMGCHITINQTTCMTFLRTGWSQPESIQAVSRFYLLL